MKLVFCYGTRPEVIKLAPLVRRCEEIGLGVSKVFTGQHVSLYNDVASLIGEPQHRIILPEHRTLNELYAGIFSALPPILLAEKPSLLIVQGDTSTVFASGVVAFNLGIPVGHLEAGLRTYSLTAPFPEEFNRQSISRLASYHWCPTEQAKSNLVSERIDASKAFVTGNTIVDCVRLMARSITNENIVVITLHRRENAFLFPRLLKDINSFALTHPELEFVFPAHPNPIVQSSLGALTASNVKIVAPMGYPEFLSLLARCSFAITDSGGIQEEAICLKKKMLVCRQTTERTEGIELGICRLAVDSLSEHWDWAMQKEDFDYINPLGDGNACEKIIKTILDQY